MSTPPAKKSKGPDTIQLTSSDGWSTLGEGEKAVVVARCNTRELSVSYKDGRTEVALRCDKGAESELWWCYASFRLIARYKNAYGDSHFTGSKLWLNSWDPAPHIVQFAPFALACYSVEVQITLAQEDDGDSFRVRSTLEVTDARDGCLVCEGQKLHVNKQSLATQSSYFNALFFGDFKEKNQNEIEIKDVTYEDLKSLIVVMYGGAVKSITVDTVAHWAQLADRFDLKIVEDRVVNFILGCDFISIHQKLLLSEKYNLAMLKERLLSMYERSDLIELPNSNEYAQFSIDLTREMHRKLAAVCDK
ncbi:hypothetical protein PFISCL1PPCAC_12218 [Pristionchus fissidentatus]|uniref:BTB domain-containing protein n=1 Tax=Pristionchus fissidentatus TaxID=1538716 RepID=A0AAV5VNC4_9BILA|nr:hypothetical protein PFISCL1PPCAC_12218 [Pristionchus fissidentatus]